MKREIEELWNFMYRENDGMISMLDLAIPSDTCVEAEEKGEEFLTKLDEVMAKDFLEKSDKESIMLLALSIIRDIHNRPEAFVSDFVDDLFSSIGDMMDKKMFEHQNED